MDGSDSYGHIQVNDRQQKAFQNIKTGALEDPFFDRKFF